MVRPNWESTIILPHHLLPASRSFSKWNFTSSCGACPASFTLCRLLNSSAHFSIQACASGDEVKVEALLADGADPNAQDDEFGQSFCCASCSLSLPLISYFRHTPDPFILHAAVVMLECVKFCFVLLKARAPIPPLPMLMHVTRTESLLCTCALLMGKLSA